HACRDDRRQLEDRRDAHEYAISQELLPDRVGLASLEERRRNEERNGRPDVEQVLRPLRRHEGKRNDGGDDPEERQALTIAVQAVLPVKETQRQEERPGQEAPQKHPEVKVRRLGVERGAHQALEVLLNEMRGDERASFPDRRNDIPRCDEGHEEDDPGNGPGPREPLSQHPDPALEKEERDERQPHEDERKEEALRKRGSGKPEPPEDCPSAASISP